jgi:transaldolase
MATEKTSEGIRLFNADAKKLEQYIGQMLNAK